jgi:hypothetical protein
MTSLPISPLGSQTGSWTRKIGSAPVMSTKRGHTGVWSLSLSEKNMSQPQDGVSDMRLRMAMIGSPLKSNALDEPEDASLTGGTRSLARRLLGLNVLSAYKKVPGKLAGKVKRPKVA